MRRIRVSHLEAFRKCCETEYGDEAQLLRALRGNPDEPTWQMSAGTAFHKLLADPHSLDGAEGEDWRLVEDGYAFDAGAVNEAKMLSGPGLCEVTARQMIGGLEIEGTCDHIRGLVITDHKTTFTQPNAKHYDASLQWRFYLLLHHAECFRYVLYHFREPKSGYCELIDIISLKFWRYPQLEQDCQTWVRQFREWAERHGLFSKAGAA